MHRKLQKEYGDMVRVQIPFQPPRIFLYNPQHVQELYANDNADKNNINIPGFSGFHTYRKNIRKDLFPGSGITVL